MITVPQAPGTVALAGDWHGNLRWALDRIDDAHAAGATTIVHLGDFGYWVPDPATRKYLFRLEMRLAELDLRLLFVDGNHEDHDRLNALPLDQASGLRPISDHVAHLPRGHRWTWLDDDGQPWTWLALGGAVSVDRHHRKIGKSWWPDEVLSDADVASAISGGVVDVVVSHDAPARVPIPNIDRKLGWPTDVMVDADEHRRLLLTACESLRPRQLGHGHYHCRYDDQLYLGRVDERPGTVSATCTASTATTVHATTTSFSSQRAERRCVPPHNRALDGQTPNAQGRSNLLTHTIDLCTLSFMDRLADLPPTFTHAQARAAGISDRRFYALRDTGALEQIGRGLFRRSDAAIDADLDLIEIALRAPCATLCLTSALSRHDLTDEIPSRIDIALPRGRRHPAIVAPARWHSFDPATFDEGRTTFAVDEELSIGLYGPERCIIDAFRLRHQEGPETAIEALRRWLPRRGSQPGSLLTMARAFPKAEPALRHALEVLL